MSNDSLEEEDKQQAKLARYLREAWKKGDRQQCEALLEQINPPTNLSVLMTLEDLLLENELRPNKYFIETSLLHDQQLQILNLVGQSPLPDTVHLLIDCLNHSNAEIAERAKELLVGKGAPVVDAIVKLLTVFPATKKYRLKVTTAGGQRIMSVLGENQDPCAFHALLQVMGHPTMRSKNWVATYVVSILAFALWMFMPTLMDSLMNTFVFTSHPMPPHSTSSPFAMLPMLFPSLLIVLWSFSSAQRAMSKAQHDSRISYYSALQKHLKQENIVPVVECLERMKTLLAPETQQLLLAFLQVRNPSTAQALTKQTRIWLLQQVNKVSTSLGLEILHFLEEVVGSEALRPLDILSKRAMSSEIRQSAGELLLKLKARLEAGTLPAQLLRASEMPDQTETLLRPARDQQDPREVEQLLRPQNETFYSPQVQKEEEEARLEQRSE